MAHNSGQFRFAVVCEGPTDRKTVVALGNRVLGEQVAWFSDLLDSGVDPWCGLDTSEHFLKWTEVQRLADERRIPRIFGGYQGGPGAPDALVARRALLLLADAAPDAVVLLRDSDGEVERKKGLHQARETRPWPFPVVVGLAHPKRECWVLAGFVPENEAERECLEAVTRDLSFDPTVHPERLSAREHGAKRDAKQALTRLVEDDPEREMRCLESFERLRERGQLTGLPEFLDELREKLAPVLTRSPQ